MILTLFGTRGEISVTRTRQETTLRVSCVVGRYISWSSWRTTQGRSMHKLIGSLPQGRKGYHRYSWAKARTC